MRKTMLVSVQTQIAQEVALKTRKRFYSINKGFAKAVASAMNDAGYVLVVQLGKAKFEKDLSSSLVAVRTDNIFVPTSLAVILAAGRTLKDIPILRNTHYVQF